MRYFLVFFFLLAACAPSRQNLNTPRTKAKPSAKPSKKSIKNPSKPPKKASSIKQPENATPEKTATASPKSTHEFFLEYPELENFSQTGKASYYANKFHGRKTASGERYNKNELTCAHPRLPFGTFLRVENVSNQKSVIVRVNDRGPFGGRIVDLSRAAAEAISMIRAGVVSVKLEVIEPPE